MLPKTYIRIPYKQFLDELWPVPAVESPRYKPGGRRSRLQNLEVTTSQITQLSGNNPPADAFAKVVHDFELAAGYELSIVSETAKGDDRWGHLNPLEDKRPSWARPQIRLRFCSHDPFRELEPPVRNSGRWTQDGHDDYRAETRTDITRRVEEIFTVQILTAAYVVIVHDSTIRLSRWDRAGTVFSRKIDYTSNPILLAEAFWRLSMLTDAQLGMDPTVSAILPGSEEYNLMERLAISRPDDLPYREGSIVEGDPDDPSRVFSYVRATLRESLQEWKKSGPLFGCRWKVTMSTEDGSVREFLVGPPFSYRDSNRPIDPRNGRVYIAIDCATEKLVFLKDVWRYQDVRNLSKREGLVLKHLNEAGVPYVPMLLCEAVVPEQNTRTLQLMIPQSDCESELEDDGSAASSTDSEDPQDDEIFQVDETGKEIVELYHYRMVISEVCFQPSFKTGRQIVSLIRDCVFAHSRATEILRLLHCDISCGNIMAYPKIEVSQKTGKPTIRWEGRLIDWELNRRVGEYRHLPFRMLTLRTWQFASYEYLLDAYGVLTVGDELESFAYVLLFLTIRYLRSNVTDVVKFTKNFFHDHESEDPRYGFKWRMMTNGCIKFVVDNDPSACLQFDALSEDKNVIPTPLDPLIKRLVWLIHARWCILVRQEYSYITVEPPSLLDPSALESDPEGFDLSDFVSRDTVPAPSNAPAKPQAQAARVMAWEMEEKLQDHSAILKLLDDALQEPWPTDDYFGDRMELW